MLYEVITGTGKSTLLKKIAKEFCEIDDVCIYYCSSDPNSLDAVILKKAKVIIVDGTAPHTFDPVYPGVSQIIRITSYNVCYTKLLRFSCHRKNLPCLCIHKYRTRPVFCHI